MEPDCTNFDKSISPHRSLVTDTDNNSCMGGKRECRHLREMLLIGKESFHVENRGSPPNIL